MSTYYCYLLECGDKTLYCGYTSNITERIKQHSNGTGAKYTRLRGPLKLVYLETFGSRSEAMRREIAIKKLSRKQKLDLIKKIEKG